MRNACSTPAIATGACGACEATANEAATDREATCAATSGIPDPASAAMARVANPDAKTDPRTATPSVPPSSRVVFDTAAPAPTWSGRRLPITASVDGAVTKPRPAAMSTIDGMITEK